MKQNEQNPALNHYKINSKPGIASPPQPQEIFRNRLTLNYLQLYRLFRGI